MNNNRNNPYNYSAPSVSAVPAMVPSPYGMMQQTPYMIPHPSNMMHPSFNMMQQTQPTIQQAQYLLQQTSNMMDPAYNTMQRSPNMMQPATSTQMTSEVLHTPQPTANISPPMMRPTNQMQKQFMPSQEDNSHGLVKTKDIFRPYMDPPVQSQGNFRVSNSYPSITASQPLTVEIPTYGRVCPFHSSLKCPICTDHWITVEDTDYHFLQFSIGRLILCAIIQDFFFQLCAV